MADVTPQRWAAALLHALGIHQTPGAIQALVGWQRAEGGHWHNSARFNPLNTTQPEPGSRTFRSVGQGAADIRIYRDWQQGLEATVKTLRNGRYGGILHALASGDPNAVASAIGRTPWGTSAATVKAAIGGTPRVAGVRAADISSGAGAAGGQSSSGGGFADGQAADVAGFLQQMLARPQAPASSGLQLPAFAAAPPLPQGYQSPVSSGGAAAGTPSPDLVSLAASLQGDTAGMGGSGAGGAPRPSGGSGGALAAGSGQVRLAPGANAPGRPLSPGILKVLRAVAHVHGGPITVGTGTNHSTNTINGTRSDHADGDAGDIPAHGQELIALGQSALIAAGMDPAEARKQRGGLYNLPYGRHRRIQIIFNTSGPGVGDHTTHLHVGVSPLR